MSMDPLKLDDLQYIISIYLAKPAGFLPNSLLKNENLTLKEIHELLSGQARSISGTCFFNAHDMQAIQLLKERHTITYEADTLATLNHLKQYQFHPQHSLFKILRVKVYALWQQHETKLNQISGMIFGNPDGGYESVDSIGDQIAHIFAYVFQSYVNYQHNGDQTVEKKLLPSIKDQVHNAWKIIEGAPEQKFKNISKLKQLAKFLFHAFHVDNRLLAEFSLPRADERILLIVLPGDQTSRLEAMAEFMEEVLASYSQNMRWFRFVAQNQISKIKHHTLKQAISLIDTLFEKITKIAPQLLKLIKSLTKPIDGLSPDIEQLLAQKMHELGKLDEIAKKMNQFYMDSLTDFRAFEKKHENDKKCSLTIELLQGTWNEGLRQDHTMLWQFLMKIVSMFRLEIQQIQESFKQNDIFLNPSLSSAHFTCRMDVALLEMNQHFLDLDRCVGKHDQMSDKEKKDVRKNLVDASDYLVMMMEAARDAVHVGYMFYQVRLAWKSVEEKIENFKDHFVKSLDRRLNADPVYKKAIPAINGFVNTFKKLIESEDERKKILVLHYAFRMPSRLQHVFHEADQKFLNKQHEMLLWRLGYLDLDEISQRLLDWKNSANLKVDITGTYSVMNSFVDTAKQFRSFLLSHLSQPKNTDQEKVIWITLNLAIQFFGNQIFDTPWYTQEEAAAISSSMEVQGLIDCFHDISYVFGRLNAFSHRPLMSWASNQWLVHSDPKQESSPNAKAKKVQNIQYTQDILKVEKLEEEELLSPELNSLPPQVISLPVQSPQIVLLDTLWKIAVSKFSNPLADWKPQLFLEEIRNNLGSYLFILRELFYLKVEDTVLPSEHQKLSKAFLCLEQILKGCILIDKNTIFSQEIEDLMTTHEMDLLVEKVIQCLPSLESQIQSLYAIIDQWQNYVPILSRYPDEWKFSRRECHQDAMDLLRVCLKILEVLPEASQSKSEKCLETPVVMNFVNETENRFQADFEECKKLFTLLNFKIVNSPQELFSKAAEYMRNIQVAMNQLDKLRQLPAVEIPYAWAEQGLLHASVLLEQSALLRLLITPVFIENDQNILNTSVSIQEKERLWKHSHRIHEFIECLQLQDVDVNKMEEFAEFLQVTTHYPYANSYKPLAKKLYNIRLWSELKQSLADQGNFIDSRLANWSMTTLGNNADDWRNTIDSNIQQEISQLEIEYLQPALYTVKLILKLIAKVD